MISALASHLLALPAWLVVLVAFAMPALESSTFLGFVFPGEIALVIGGVVASQGRVSLAAVLVAGVVGAVVGDSVGYLVGRRYGRRVLEGAFGRFVRADHLDRAEQYVAERGGRAVFFGRFTASLRVVVPGMAGMAGVRYRTFAAYNVAGGALWGTASVLLGYLGGSSWKHLEHLASGVGLLVLGLFVGGLVLGWVLRRRRRAVRRRAVRRRAPQVPGAGSDASEPRDSRRAA